MPRKDPFREQAETRQVRWYQWEFIRRNPQYRSDFQGFTDRFGPWFQERGFWYDRVEYQGEDQNYFFKVISPDEHEICRKWDINWLCSPDWSFPKFGSYLDKSDGYEYKPGEHVYLPTGSRRASLAPVGEEERRFRFIDTRIDVTWPIDDSLAGIRHRINLAREVYDERFGQDKRPKRRRRLDHYGLYLRVWDLRQEGKTFGEIAQILYPEEYAQQAETKAPSDSGNDADESWKERLEQLEKEMGKREAYAKMDQELGFDHEVSTVPAVAQRVRDDYCRAKSLIEGGYKEIR